MDVGGRSRVGGLGALLVAATAMPLMAQATGHEAAPGERAARTVVVEMTDFTFEPSRIVARPGDTVVFLQTTATPHNVEFRDVPGGTELGEDYQPSVAATGTRAIDFPPPRMGPFLLEKGDKYEIVIGDFFAAGEHEIVCTPHEAMGMKGLLIVDRASDVIPVGAGE